MADDTQAAQPQTPAGEDDEKTRKLKSVLYREEQQCRSWQDGELTRHREDSLKYYQRDPLGDEEPGQSQVVTSEYLDTVESIMPAMMRVFTSGDSVVEFSPDNPGDEQFAEEASSYIPHVLMRENEGYTWFYWFIKDALMYRLAWGAVDLEEIEQVKTKSFGPIPEDAFAMLSEQATQMAEKLEAEVEIEAEQEETDDTGKQPKSAVNYSKGHPDSHCAICQHFQGNSCQVTASAGSPTPGRIDPDYWCEQYVQGQPQLQPATFSGTITTTRKVKKVKIDNIAPEDGLVSPMARHIDEASMTGYRKKVTASELRILGLDQDTIDSLSTDDLYTVEQAQRQPDVIQATSERDTREDSERTLWVVVAFIKFDWDEDGISEMRRVVYAHAGGQVSAIIENDEWTDGVAPIVAGTPVLMSHTIPGRDIFDLVKDLQDVSTAVTRGMLDNIYKVNRPRPIVDDDVDLASLLDWTPGMPVRLRQGRKYDGTNVGWVTAPPIMDKTLLVLQWKDEALHKRTGVQPSNQGVLDESMNPSATGASLATAAADARTELIARTLAEGPIKRLFRLIYRAVKRAATGPITYRAMDSWVTVDPTKWPDDMTLEVNVGLGAGNKQQQLSHLMLVGQGQQALIQAQGGTNGPAVQLNHAANTFRKILQTVGIKSTDQYVAPDQQIAAGVAKQQDNPPPNPEMAKVQAQSQAKMAELHAKSQSDAVQQQHDAQLSQQKLASDIQLKREEAAADMQIQREKAALDLQIKREAAALDAQLKREELLLEAQLKREQIQSSERVANNTNIREQQVSE